MLPDCKTEMIACLDVHYAEKEAWAAAVTFDSWTDATPASERVVCVTEIEPYVPGRFFRRELPCLLAVLRELPPVSIAIIDGYVWLDGKSKPGLGAHFYSALNEQIPVIGVAKTEFLGAENVRQVTRGNSARPLFISAAGIDLDEASKFVKSLHGIHRIPTLLKRVDQLCRRGCIV